MLPRLINSAAGQKNVDSRSLTLTHLIVASSVLVTQKYQLTFWSAGIKEITTAGLLFFSIADSASGQRRVGVEFLKDRCWL